MKKRQIVILGSTGSIGTQALDVIRQHSDCLCDRVANLQVSKNVSTRKR